MTNRCTTAQSTGAIPRSSLPAIATLAATAALTVLTAAAPADAAPRQARPEPTTEAAAPRGAGEPIMAIVSIKSQKVTIYDAEGWILRAPVSTGTTGRETPAGVSALWRSRRIITRASMTMPGCRTCCASPGTASRCTAGRCPDMLPRRLRADAFWLCGEAVRQGPHRHACDHLAD